MKAVGGHRGKEGVDREVREGVSWEEKRGERRRQEGGDKGKRGEVRGRKTGGGEGTFLEVRRGGCTRKERSNLT